MHLDWRGFLWTIAVMASLTSGFWMSLRPWEGPTTPAFHRIPLQTPTDVESGDERLVIPVLGVRATDLADTFRDARSNGRVHDAIDIIAPRGTPVIAAAAGRVEKLFLSKAGGNTVYVRSRGGQTIYYYAHLDRYAPGLAEGSHLAKGAPIGSVGYTGNASANAPHLHFAVLRTSPDRRYYEASKAVNPYPLLTRR